MIELAKLAMFLDVAGAGSLTRAAQLMGTAPPVLSRRLAALENEIGGSLFVRTGRGLVLSDLGHSLLPQARDLLAAAETLEANARAASGAAFGEVRIGMMASFAGTIGIEVMTEVARRHPAIQLKIFEGPTGRIDKWLNDGVIDIAVTLRDSRVEIGDLRTIAYLETYLIGATDAAPVQPAEVGFADLDGLPLILSATPSGLRQTLDRMAAEHGIDLNVRFEVDGAAMHLELARRGLGFAVLTPQAALLKADTSGLRLSRITRPTIERHVALGNSVRRVPSAAVQVVMGILSETGERLKATGGWLSLEESTAAEDLSAATATT